MSARSRLRPWRARLLFVTGGGGFLGSHIVNGPAGDRWETFAPPSKSMDVRNTTSVMQTVREWHPTAIVHCAYRKDEHDTIVTGSVNVAQAAHHIGARLIHISSDLVFPGRLSPYSEVDDTRPMIQYGRDKLEAEHGVALADPNAVIVRTSVLYGRRHLSPAQVDTVKVLRGEKSMSFFTDEIRSFTDVDDLAAAVAWLADERDISGVLHVAGPQPMSRADFARVTAEQQGLSTAHLHVSTTEASGQVRPTRVVLDSTRAYKLGIRMNPVTGRD